jgi:hypothetical protein
MPPEFSVCVCCLILEQQVNLNYPEFSAYVQLCVYLSCTFLSVSQLPSWAYSSSGFPNHTHLDTPQFVRFLHTSDQPIAETTTWLHTTLTTDRHPCPQRDFFVPSLYFILTSFSWVYWLLPFVLYCTTHTTQHFMSPVGYEPAIPASELPQTYTLDRSSFHLPSLLEDTRIFMQAVFVGGVIQHWQRWWWMN